jgi:hypothetical protein
MFHLIQYQYIQKMVTFTEKLQKYNFFQHPFTTNKKWSITNNFLFYNPKVNFISKNQ